MDRVIGILLSSPYKVITEQLRDLDSKVKLFWQLELCGKSI